MRRARALAVIVMAVSTIIPAGMIHATPINRSTATSSTSADLTGIAAHPNGRGAWSVDRAGGVFTTGNARFFGSIPGLRAAGHAVGPSDVVDVAATPTGRGYWLVDRAGGVHAFGDARFHGSVPGLRAAGARIGGAAVVAIAATPRGNGYWLLDDQGGMFAFGDARFRGSVPGLRTAGTPVGPANLVGMAPTRTGRGYWLLDDQGGMFAFGDARFRGSVPGLRAAGTPVGPARLVGVAATSSGKGYWLLDERGGVFTFGNASFRGSLGSAGVAATAVGIAPRSDGGYQVATAGGDLYRFDRTTGATAPDRQTPQAPTRRNRSRPATPATPTTTAPSRPPARSTSTTTTTAPVKVPVATPGFAGRGTVGHRADIPGVHRPATLTTRSGDMATSRDGQVIRNLNITGVLRVRHADVLIEDVKVRAIDVQADNDPRASATIRWTTVGSIKGWTGGYNALGTGNYTVYRSEIRGAVDLLKVNVGYVDVRESWIHGGHQWASDPGQGGSHAHVDFLQTVLKGNVSRITLVDNSFDAWVFRSPKDAWDVYRNLGASATGTGALSFFQHKNGYRIGDILVKGNVLNGDVYSYFHITDNTNGQAPRSIRIIDNVVWKNYSTFGANKLAGFRTPSAVVWRGNTDQHGRPISVKGTRSS